MSFFERLVSLLCLVGVLSLVVMVLAETSASLYYAGVGATMRSHPIETLDGWDEIEHLHPVVHESVFGYVVVTDGGDAYWTTIFTHREVRRLLAGLAE